MNDASVEQVVGVGFSDFWQQAHDKFPMFFRSASVELVLIGNEAFTASLSEPLHKLARHLARMVWNSLSSILLLALNGCGVDAMKVARGMFETSITLGYLRLHPECVDDYFDYHFIIQKQRSDFMRDHAPEQFARVPSSLLEKIESDFITVAPRFRNRAGKLRGGWSNVSIREMAKAVGKEGLYLTFYRFASSMHHGDIGGVFAQTQDLQDEDILDVDIVPSDAWLGEALIIAHRALISVLRDYNEITKVGIDKVVERADKTFFDMWGNG